MSREAPAPFLRSCRGTRPRFASGTLMSLRAIPSSRAWIRRGCRIFPPRLRRGTRHPDAPPSPCFAAESVRADTLRAHPENAAAPALCPSAERRYRPKVTSGCPKRSEGGSPVGTRTITVFPCGAKLSTVSPSRAAHPVRKPRRGSEPSGPPPARTYPSRPAHPEERAGWRHRSSPRRARVQRLHARQRQPQG